MKPKINNSTEEESTDIEVLDDLEQEYLELYAHPYNTTVEMIDNLHKRLLRLEKGTE